MEGPPGNLCFSGWVWHPCSPPWPLGLPGPLGRWTQRRSVRSAKAPPRAERPTRLGPEPESSAQVAELNKGTRPSNPALTETSGQSLATCGYLSRKSGVQEPQEPGCATPESQSQLLSTVQTRTFASAHTYISLTHGGLSTLSPRPGPELAYKRATPGVGGPIEPTRNPYPAVDSEYLGNEER